MSKHVANKKIIVVIIAYNAAKTIEQTYNDIPKDWVDLIIIGDDCSKDNTYEIAKQLPAVVAIRNKKNQHCGGNQKVVYDKALELGADIIILLHGDNQYDSKKIPEMIKEITDGGADAVLGSRILGKQTKEGGMPLYKFSGNKLLNFLQNRAYGLQLSDYASGYKAYTKEVLETIPYRRNRNDFIFDEEVNTQIVYFGFNFAQIPIPTRYFAEASSVGFWTSVHYGIFTLWTVAKYLLQVRNIAKFGFLEPE